MLKIERLNNDTRYLRATRAINNGRKSILPLVRGEREYQEHDLNPVRIEFERIAVPVYVRRGRGIVFRSRYGEREREEKRHRSDQSILPLSIPGNAVG